MSENDADKNTQCLRNGIRHGRNKNECQVLCSLAEWTTLPYTSIELKFLHQQILDRNFTLVCWFGCWFFFSPAKKMKQTRKCEVAFAYNPLNSDELKLEVGETIEIIREVEYRLLSLLKHLNTWSEAFASCLLHLLTSQKLGIVCKSGRWWNVCSANLQCVNKLFIDSVGPIISLYSTPRVTKHVSALQLNGKTYELIGVVLRVNATKLSEIFSGLMNYIHVFKCSLTHFLAVLSSWYHLHNRLKMDGGWELRMAKLGHFLLTLSMKFLFHQKVGKVMPFLLSLHVIQSKVNLQLFFSFYRCQAQWGQSETQTHWCSVQ